jgi:energy-coupling factor transporter transmembrane protein EcfT
MPDIFVSWMILSIFIIFFRKEQHRLHSFLLTLIFIISVISHFSVLLAATTIIALLLILNAFFKWESRKKVWFLASWLVLGWLAIPIINVSYGEQFSISRCKTVSLMARIVETGVAAEFLNENCVTGKYSLCTYRDSLPAFGYLFAWDPSSPLYSGGCWDTGWGNCWLEKDEEYGRLISDIVSSPRYVKKLIGISSRDAYRQLIDFRIGVLVPMTEESAPYGTIKTFYPQNFEAYKKAEQYKRILYFKLISNIQLVLVILTLIFVPVLFFLRVNGIHLKQVYQLTLIIGIGLLMNAAVCSTFSTVVDRYQSRVIWLAPLVFMVMVITLFQTKKQESA